MSLQSTSKSTEPTIKELVLRQLDINPNISLKDCQTVVDGLKKGNFYKIKKQLTDSTPSLPKKRILKKIHSSKGDGGGFASASITNLTPEALKKIILSELNNQVTPGMIKAGIDFLKSFGDEEKVQELDLSKFLLIGEDNPDS